MAAKPGQGLVQQADGLEAEGQGGGSADGENGPAVLKKFFQLWNGLRRAVVNKYQYVELLGEIYRFEPRLIDDTEREFEIFEYKPRPS